MTGISNCIGCGCHDFAACVDEATGRPCSWLVLDTAAAVGVCSACPDSLVQWNQGMRTATRARGLFTSLIATT